MKLQITLRKPTPYEDHADTVMIALDGDEYAQFQLESAIRLIVDREIKQPHQTERGMIACAREAEIIIKIISL